MNIDFLIIYIMCARKKKAGDSDVDLWLLEHIKLH